VIVPNCVPCPALHGKSAVLRRGRGDDR